MSLPTARSRGSDAHSKIAIPRLAKPQPINNGLTEKPRASRACISCRQLKMRCSGESPCQRCIANKRACSFPQARKGRLKSVSEQNEHMIRLMKHLRERVTDEDKRQIEELLERVADNPRARKKERDTASSSSVTEEVHEEEDATVETFLGHDPPLDQEPVSSEFSGKISNLQWLLRASPQEAGPIKATLPDIENADSALSQEGSASPVSTREVHQSLVTNSTLLEIFWHLQREPAEKARMFLEHVKNSEQIRASNVEEWLHDPPGHRTDSPFSQSRRMSNASTANSLATRTANRSANDATSHVSPNSEVDQAQNLGFHVTIATVKRAVDMFFRSTGMLFYIVPKEQLDAILDSIQLPDNTPFTAILKSSISLQARARLAELCGMAAVGLLYLRISDEERAPPAKLAHYFYSITKQMLDSAVEANPLRAMKVCALLALYNIYVKARVALAYVELGSGLAQLHGLNEQHHSVINTEELLDYKRTWRTLLTFNGWLAASLGYASGQDIPNLAALQLEHGVEEQDIIQQELVKVTIIKAKIIRAIPVDGAANDYVIDNFRKELNEIREGLPDWMTMGALISDRQTTPLRRVIMYFHLFFLSAMQLLYRRAMADPMHLNPGIKNGVRDDLMAAKMVARMLALMNQEGYIGQFCWMCIYSSYTSGIIILQAAVQKILAGYHSSTWIADLTLAAICVDVLRFCAEVDSVAGRMRDIVQLYMEVIRSAVKTEFLAVPGDNNSEDELVDYLFIIPSGDSNLHKAARDLLRLIQYPFGTSLELIPEGGPQPPLRNSLVNWMEAAVGIPQEWDWELQNCGLKPNHEQNGNSSQMRDVLSKLNPGRFVSMGETSPWTAWTEHSF